MNYGSNAVLVDLPRYKEYDLVGSSLVESTIEIEVVFVDELREVNFLSESLKSYFI